MNKHTTIYIVRHGESEANIQENKNTIDRSMWDETGAPLTTLGKQQVQALVQRLQTIHLDAIFSSTLHRARETAEIISSGRNIPIEPIATIYEREYGEEYWKLSRPERIKLEEGIFALDEEAKFVHKITPNSESAKQALDRFTTFLNNRIPLYRGKTILVVNHGGVMRFLLIYLRWAKFNEMPVGSIKNTGYYVIETDGENFRIKETNGVNKKIIE